MARLPQSGRGRLAGVGPAMRPSTTPTRNRPTQFVRTIPGGRGTQPGGMSPPDQGVRGARAQIAHISQYPPKQRRTEGAHGHASALRVEPDPKRPGRTTRGVSGGSVPR